MVKFKIEIPSKEIVKGTRERRQLTCKQAAELIGLTERAWQQYEKGTRKMRPQFWELFNIKCNQRKYR